MIIIKNLSFPLNFDCDHLLFFIKVTNEIITDVNIFQII